MIQIVKAALEEWKLQYAEENNQEKVKQVLKNTKGKNGNILGESISFIGRDLKR